MGKKERKLGGNGVEVMLVWVGKHKGENANKTAHLLGVEQAGKTKQLTRQNILGEKPTFSTQGSATI